MPTERRKATEAEAKALASSVRVRIIRLTYSEALTNKELAQRLGRDPATTLHHVRRLVATGFLEPQPSRKGNRGAKEIPYRSTGLSWRLTNLRTQAIKEAMLGAFLTEVTDVDAEELHQTRVVAQLSDEEREEFRRRFQELFDEFAARPRHPDGELTAVYLAMYPSR